MRKCANVTAGLAALGFLAACGSNFTSGAVPTAPEGFFPYAEQLGGQVTEFNPCSSYPSVSETTFSASVTAGANERRGVVVDQRAHVTKRGRC